MLSPSTYFLLLFFSLSLPKKKHLDQPSFPIFSTRTAFPQLLGPDHPTDFLPLIDTYLYADLDEAAEFPWNLSSDME